MYVESIELENIRSHINTVIDFPMHTLLIGDIGSGKSTILQAIEFGLFGAQRGFVDSNHLLRKDSDFGSVKITLNLGKKIIIFRTLKRKKSVVSQDVGYLEVDGVKEELMPSELKSRVATILGYPENNTNTIFRYSVYATQEQMKSIDARLNTLRVIFGIDKYKNIIENSQNIVRNIKKDIAYNEGLIHNLTENKLELADLKESIKKTNEDLDKQRLINSNKQLIVNNIKEVYDSLCLSLKDVEIKYERSSFIEEKINKNKENISKFSEKIKSMDESVKVMMNDFSSIVVPIISKDDFDLEKKINAQQELINRNRILKSNLSEKIKLYESNIKDIEIELKDGGLISFQIEKLIEEIEGLKKVELDDLDKIKKLSNVEQELNLAKEDLVKLESIFNRESNQVDAILDLSVCPTCMQEVDVEYKNKIKDKLVESSEIRKKELILINDKIKKLQEDSNLCNILEKKVQEIKNEIYKKNVMLEDLDKKKSVLKVREDKFSLMKQDLSLLNKKLLIISEFDFESQEKELEDLKKKNLVLQEVKLLEEKKFNLGSRIKESQKQILDLQKDISFLQDENINLDLEMKELKDSKKLCEDIKKQITAKDIDLKKAKDELHLNLLIEERLKTSIQHYLDNLDKLSKQVNFKEDAQNKSIFLNNVKNWLTDYFSPLMTKIENHIFYQIYSDFNSRFSKWFDVLIEDDSISVSIDERFTPIITQNGYDMDIDSLSGGERTSVALAYRLALNKIVNDLVGLNTKDILILDEPTEGFSTEQLDRVRDVLLELEIPQILLVSHEQKMDSFVSSVLLVEKKSNVSSVSLVSTS